MEETVWAAFAPRPCYRAARRVDHCPRRRQLAPMPSARRAIALHGLANNTLETLQMEPYETVHEKNLTSQSIRPQDRDALRTIIFEPRG